MSIQSSLLLLWIFAAVILCFGWRWQEKHRNAGIADVLWACCIGVGALWLAAAGSGAPWPRLCTALLGAAWGLRLGAHLWHRVRGEPEDGRYQYLRAQWQGSRLKFFLFFQVQALSVVLFVLPYLAASRNPTVQPAWLIGGALVWLISVAGEALADRQLARFRADPAHRGRTCRAGLWRYSRHPNYFFEWLHWFSYVCIAVGSPLWWLAWSGPVVMYVFLRWISGIPYTEAQALRSRGDDYRAYQQSTSLLFPWFPKRLPEGVSKS